MGASPPYYYYYYELNLALLRGLYRRIAAGRVEQVCESKLFGRVYSFLERWRRHKLEKKTRNCMPASEPSCADNEALLANSSRIEEPCSGEGADTGCEINTSWPCPHEPHLLRYIKLKSCNYRTVCLDPPSPTYTSTRTRSRARSLSLFPSHPPPSQVWVRKIGP